MSRLLLVSSHFPPDRSAGTQRVLRFANYLQNHGWSTFVLTIDPMFYRRSIPVDEGLVSRADPRLIVYRTGAFRGVSALVRWRDRLSRGHGRIPSTNGQYPAKDAATARPAWRRNLVANLFEFPDEEVGWLGKAVVRGLQIVRRHDIQVVVSSAPPFTCHLVGQALKTMCDVQWVADFRDPWSRAPWGKQGSERARQWLEQQVVKRADAVVLNTPELFRAFTEWYGVEASRKFHTVANGYDADIVGRFTGAPLPPAPPLILTHAGNLYGNRNPTPLLEALAKCLRDGIVPRDAIRLHLVGKISGRFNVDGSIARLGLNDVVIKTPPVTHDESLKILAVSHVAVVIQPGTALQIPAKLYEYVGLRRAILALADEGGVARVVRESGLGFVVPPDDVNGIAAALRRLYEEHSTGTQMAANDACVSRFDARRQSEILASLVAGLYPARRPTPHADGSRAPS